MDTPNRPTSPVPPNRTSRLPRAIVLCLLASVLLGALTEWPVWVCVAVAVPASALLSGLVTGYLRGGGRPATGAGA